MNIRTNTNLRLIVEPGWQQVSVGWFLCHFETGSHVMQVEKIGRDKDTNAVV